MSKKDNGYPYAVIIQKMWDLFGKEQRTKDEVIVECGMTNSFALACIADELSAIRRLLEVLVKKGE